MHELPDVGIRCLHHDLDVFKQGQGVSTNLERIRNLLRLLKTTNNNLVKPLIMVKLSIFRCKKRITQSFLPRVIGPCELVRQFLGTHSWVNLHTTTDVISS